MFFKQLKKNKNKGFTLVELIVTFALFAIMGLGAMVLLIQTSNIFQSTSKLNNIQNATLIITDTIKAHLYGVEEAEITYDMEMPSTREDGYGYLCFNSTTTMLEKAIGMEEALGISMEGVTGLGKGRYFFDVYFYNSGESDVILLQVDVYDTFSDTPTETIYEYSTSMYLHNLQYAADVAARATAEETTADPAGATTTTGEPDYGHIGGTDGSIYGTCIKYRVAD